MTQHYTHVSEEDAARAINSLPAVMGNATGPVLPPAKDRDVELRAILEGMMGKTWKQDRERAVAILDGAPENGA